MKKFYILVALILAFHLSQAQNNIAGQITNSEGSPILNTNVFLKNSSFGTSVDARGNWELKNIPSGSYTLVASSEGYTTLEKELAISSNLKLNLQLEEDIYSLPQLVIESYTLSLGKQGLQDLPGSVDYIGPQELKVYQHSNVNNILKSIPGVNIQEEEGFGLRPNIGLRGSGLERSSKITLMEDGILAAPAPYAAPSAYYFPTVGRMNGVEVMKGSSQVRFGPFTTGGAINFISTPIPGQFQGKVGVTAGNFGYRSVQTSVGNSFKNIGFVVESFNYGATGFKELPSGGDTGFNKSDYQAKVRVNTNASARNYQSLSFMVGQTKEKSNDTYLGLTDEDFSIDPYQRYAASQVDNMDALQERFSVQHYLELPGIFNVVTTAYRNNFKRNWYKLQSVAGSGLNSVLSNPDDNPNAFGLLNGSVNTTDAELTMRANNRAYYSQGIQTVFDIEFQTGEIAHDIHISTRIHQDQEDRFQWEDDYSIENKVMKLEVAGIPGSQANRIETANASASYIFYKLAFQNLTVTPGARYENIKIQREDFGRTDLERTGSNLSTRTNRISVFLPGVGLNYQFNPRLNLFAGVHKGFAPPGSSSETDAEQSVNYELGLRKYTRVFEATAVVYLNDYKNLLGADLAATGGIGSGELFNAGEAITRGLELQLGYDILNRNKKFSLPVNLAYTYTNAEFTSDFEANFDEWGAVESGFQLPYIADHQINLSSSLNHKYFMLNFSTKYQSELRTSPGKGEIQTADKIGDFLVSDVAFNIFLNKWAWFNFSVTNLFDNQYEVARRPAGLIPGMPRAYKLGINVTL